MNTKTYTKCNHTFCIAGGKTREAIAHVEYTMPHARTGEPVTIAWDVCEGDYPALMQMVTNRNEPYTVTNL